MDWDYGYGAGYLLMMLSMIAFWALVIGGIVFAVRAVSGGGAEQQPYRPDAEQVLAQRYARGEIDDAEYRQRLAVLRS